MADANRKAPRLNEAKFSFIDERVIEDTEHIYVGEMVEQDDSTLEVAAATNAAAKYVLGVSTLEVDNADDGLKLGMISTAVHGMANAGSILNSDLGELAYVADAATVAVSGDNIAGRIAEVDIDGGLVYVDFDPAKKN